MSFWHHFPQAHCLPDHCNCEFISDAFIRQPSAFWSSLVYLALGILLYQEVQNKNFKLKLWTSLTLLLGVSSMFAHMSFIQLAMAMDFAAIIMVLSFFALTNFLELLKLSRVKILLTLVLYYISIVGVMYYMSKWSKIGVCLLIFLFALSDLLRSMGWNFLKAPLLQYTIIMLVASFTFFIMDEMRIACDPHSPWQLHSFWHAGTAVSIYLYGKWRFSDLSPSL